MVLSMQWAVPAGRGSAGGKGSALRSPQQYLHSVPRDSTKYVNPLDARRPEKVSSKACSAAKWDTGRRARERLKVSRLSQNRSSLEPTLSYQSATNTSKQRGCGGTQGLYRPGRVVSYSSHRLPVTHKAHNTKAGGGL